MENITIPAVLFSLFVVFAIIELYLVNKQSDVFSLIPEALGKSIAWLKYRNINKNSLEYYRDILTDISPLLVSYVENYHLRYKTDIVAFLLKMYADGKINFQDGKVIKDEKAILSRDELRIYHITTLKFSNAVKKARLEDEMYKEAVENGYIEEKQNKTLQKLMSYISAVLVLGAIFILVVIYVINELDLPILPSIVIGIIIFIFLFCLLCVLTGYVNYNKGYVLTPKGADLREKIFGLKRFIKDFSMLNQKEKEDVMLWDDFLVYSVIFGQNKKIKRDILQHYNIDYKIIKSMKQ